MTSFAQTIRNRRRDDGVTLQDRADEIGVTLAALQRAEKGSVPRPDNAKLIAEFYGSTVSTAWPSEDPAENVSPEPEDLAA